MGGSGKFWVPRREMMNRRIAFWTVLIVANAAMWFVFVRKDAGATAENGKREVVTNRVPVALAAPSVTVIRTNGFSWPRCGDNTGKPSLPLPRQQPAPLHPPTR